MEGHRKPGPIWSPRLPLRRPPVLITASTVHTLRLLQNLLPPAQHRERRVGCVFLVINLVAAACSPFLSLSLSSLLQTLRREFSVLRKVNAERKMASGKNPRTDSRRSSSSYCSTVTLSLFVALCLVGVWMLTSSDVVPLNISTPENKSNVKRELPKEKTFVDISGDESEDSQGERNFDASVEQIAREKTADNQILEAQEANSLKESEEAKNGSDDALNKDGEHNSSETGNGEQNSDKNTSSDQEQSENGNESDVGEKSDGTQDKNIGEQMEEKVEEKQVTETELSSTEEKTEEKQETQMESNSVENKTENQSEKNIGEVFPDGAHSEILNETSTQNGAWSTQAMESKNEKEAQKSPSNGQLAKLQWKLCSVSAGPDYIPCLDNQEAIKKLPSTKHYEHRERHCPEEGPTCLVPLPEGYRQPIKWPKSRDKIWYFNVPHTKLAAVKGHQNWVKVSGEYLTFPGGGTQFKHGALHYIDFIQETLHDIAWGKRTRVILDVGCGVASFGGFLFERDVLTMSFAPKDEHEAQVQFALERGIPAISAVMGTKRLPFPGGIFDVVHCARCRVPWHIEGGTLLLELNRLLRPGGYFVWSATPVYQSLPQDVEIWEGEATHVGANKIHVLGAGED
ncbi:hypothetical protein Taro_013588 [Colocasia esculenta]|uniref:Methyltransferase n=1 Tax=Colocasia esculenta TaxID=4460 RepID=A0A843UMM5_COLES|nr:hypothetical protein [Colocasia esculenta]